MYNIAKVAKGEILPYFNEVFDALCKLAADVELSVKNGAELLDRLIKDIVSEKAASYISIRDSAFRTLNGDAHSNNIEHAIGPQAGANDHGDTPSVQDTPLEAFSLTRFIPLLSERIYVLNPFTRIFLVSWITLLDSIPDLELVAFLPDFLDGLLRFLNDPSKDVQVATQHALDGFLNEIRRIAGLQQRRTQPNETSSVTKPKLSLPKTPSVDGSQKQVDLDEKSVTDSDDWIPGQDVIIDYPRLVTILMAHIRSSERQIQIAALRWIAEFFKFAPGNILSFAPQIISLVLPAMANDDKHVSRVADQVSEELRDLIMDLLTEDTNGLLNEASGSGSPASGTATEDTIKTNSSLAKGNESLHSATTITKAFDYNATVYTLVSQLNDANEWTRVAALNWLVMLHRFGSSRNLAIEERAFPTLLKTLSDSSDEVVSKDLHLLAQIATNGDESYFNALMLNLLTLFNTDRQLLESRGNLIVRRLCVSLSAERIYRSLAAILMHETDLDFASVMVQNLQDNLTVAPELADLRRRLRNLDKVGRTFSLLSY